jgi:NTP pyrophosphatase (non-canonical NTP hydrolase)
MEQIKQQLREFAKERDWDQFHTPKNLAMALSGEVGELIELFQWLTPEQSVKDGLSPEQVNNVKEEIADVFLYLIRLADKLDIDLNEVAMEKLKLNAKKYPVGLSKSNAIKYNKR